MTLQNCRIWVLFPSVFSSVNILHSKENEDKQHLLKCSEIVNNLQTEAIVTQKVEYVDICSIDKNK